MVSDSGKNFSNKEKSYSDRTQKPAKEELEHLREILRYFNQILHTFPPWETEIKTRRTAMQGPWERVQSLPVKPARLPRTLAMKGLLP